MTQVREFDFARSCNQIRGPVSGTKAPCSCGTDTSVLCESTTWGALLIFALLSVRVIWGPKSKLGKAVNYPSLHHLLCCDFKIVPQVPVQVEVIPAVCSTSSIRLLKMLPNDSYIAVWFVEIRSLLFWKQWSPLATQHCLLAIFQVQWTFANMYAWSYCLLLILETYAVF